MPTCIKCKESLPLELFAKNRARKNGLQNRCRSCQAEMAARHYRENKARYQERNRGVSPQMRRAQHAVEVALKGGRMTKAPCETCGSTPAEAHHDDYGKPLMVRWLCRSHHQEWHRTHGEAANK